MYCSEKCRSAAWVRYHKYECESLTTGIVARILCEALHAFGDDLTEMEKFFTDNKNQQKYLMELDLSDPETNTRNLLLAVYNTPWMEPLEPFDNVRFLLGELSEMHEDLDRHITTHGKFIETFLNKLARRGYTQLMGYPLKKEDESRENMEYVAIANHITPLRDCFQHSCDSNIRAVPTNDGEILFVTAPIKAGSELFVTYGRTFVEKTKVERQQHHKIWYKFECRCKACENDFPTLNQLFSMTMDKIMSKESVELAKNLAAFNALPHEKIQANIKVYADKIVLEDFPTRNNCLRKRLIMTCLWILNRPEFRFS